MRNEQPDIVLVDASITDVGLTETIDGLSAVNKNLKFVVLANHHSPATLDAAHRSGVHGYFLRGAVLEDLAPALRIIHRGGSVQPFVLPRQSRQEPADGVLASRFKSFTNRDLHIIRGVTDGLTNTEIAGPLHLSEATVKARISRIKKHLGVTTRVQIAVQCVQAGMMAFPSTLP
ncbi:response regulator transcription factor [Arthrobacter sp. Br18]|uniref:response regulator transcription factor n=1 Tax=Arthrobacter sp. Br18 TaxID=1312954 RepID=UPI0006861B12|nr:response regulator transcription factor [Arthrobacter sp. Br18]